MGLLRNLRNKLVAWGLRFILKQAARMSAEALDGLPWESTGQQVNVLMDAKLTPKVADQVQDALGNGLELFTRGLRAKT